jgi:hypothetical protein
MGSATELNPRYQGRPLLLIYEQYALDLIGALPPEKQQLARTVVQRVFGGGPIGGPRFERRSSGRWVSMTRSAKTGSGTRTPRPAARTRASSGRRDSRQASRTSTGSATSAPAGAPAPPDLCEAALCLKIERRDGEVIPASNLRVVVSATGQVITAFPF